MDGAEEEMNEGQTRLFHDTENQGLEDEHEDEREDDKREWSKHSVLPFLMYLSALASWTWLVILMTGMSIGRAEPFKRGCPNYNPYNN